MVTSACSNSLTHRELSNCLAQHLRKEVKANAGKVSVLPAPIREPAPLVSRSAWQYACHCPELVDAVKRSVAPSVSAATCREHKVRVRLLPTEHGP